MGEVQNLERTKMCDKNVLYKETQLWCDYAGKKKKQFKNGKKKVVYI